MQKTEIIAIGLYHPDLIDRDSHQIRKEALKSSDLTAHQFIDLCGDSSGLSVARVDFESSLPELKAMIRQIAARPKKDGQARAAVGHSTIEVQWVLNHGGLVLDDGKVGFASHAVVRTNMKRSEFLRLREDMLKELNRTLVLW